MSSTLLLEAASSSCMLNDAWELNEVHDSHLSHASPSGPGLEQLIVLAKILAQVVFPTPLRTAKKIGLCKKIVLYCVLKCSGYGILPHNHVKCGRPVFSGRYNEVIHSGYQQSVWFISHKYNQIVAGIFFFKIYCLTFATRIINTIINQKRDVESVRNRFHCNSRFV